MDLVILLDKYQYTIKSAFMKKIVLNGRFYDLLNQDSSLKKNQEFEIKLYLLTYMLRSKITNRIIK